MKSKNKGWTKKEDRPTELFYIAGSGAKKKKIKNFGRGEGETLG